jgi:hypothetical protein
MRAALGSVRVWTAVLIAAAAAAALIELGDGDDANGGSGAGGDTAAAGWTELPASPVARSEIGAARIGGSIYAVGGYAAPTGSTTGTVSRYEIATGKWSVVAPLPTAVNHPGVASTRGKLYVHGGYSGEGFDAPTDALQVYDPATGTWTLRSPSGPSRAAHTLVPRGRLLHAVGGVSEGAPSRTVEIYDAGSDRWRPGPPMPTAREHLAGARVRDRIYALAGRVNGLNLRTVEALDTRSGRWLRLKPLRHARSGFGAATVRGRIVVVGGESLAPGGSTIPQVELYEPARQRIRKLPPMIRSRHGLGVVARGRRVFAIDGGPMPGFTFSSALEMLQIPPSALRASGGNR